MLCRGCRNFGGNPCASCRTLSRLQFLLERNQLPASSEARVVGALRQAAGELCDVVEQLGVFRTTPLPRGFPLDQPPPPPPRVEPKEEAEPSNCVAKVEKAKKEDKKAAKEAKREKKRKAEPGVEETPAEEKTEEVDKGASSEAIRAAKASPLIGKEKKRRDEQEEVDHYVSTHPERFGLGSLSIRGTAARHFKESESRRDDRPASPPGPPPARSFERASGGGDRQRERSRSKKKKKKSKGERHRIRGREFWRRAKEQEKWGQRQKPRRKPDHQGQR